MTEELDKLYRINNFLKRTNAKIKLIKLIEEAKREYDNFEYDLAFESLSRAYELDENNPTVLRGLGCINQFRGNYDTAIDFYKRALEFSFKKEIEYTLLGTVYYIQDKLDDAITYFNLAIDVNDDYDAAYEGRNQAMLENHVRILDLQEALKKYF